MSDLQQIYSDVNTKPLASPAVAPQQFGQTPTIPKPSGLPGALNTSMQPGTLPVRKASSPVSAEPKPFDIYKPSTEGLVTEEIKTGELLQRANENLAKATAAQADAQAEGKAQVIQEYADKTHEAVDQKAKQLAKWEYPEMHPTETNIKELGGLFSVMSVIGLMLGGAGKLSAMNALGSMSGMMKGWQQGKQDLFKKEKERFDARFAEVKQIHADIENSFNEYMRLLSTDKEAAMYAREELVRKTGSSSILTAQLEKGQLEAYAATLKSIKTSIEHIEDKALSSKQFEETKGIERKRLEIEQAKLDFEKNKERNKISELGGNATLQAIIGKVAKNDKIADSIVANATAVSRLDNILNRLKDPEVVIGVKSKLAGITQQIKSVFGDEGDITDDRLRQYVNGAIDPSEKNAVLQKDALFAAFEAERAANGNRLTVQMMKQAGSVLNPTNYTKEGYAAVLGGRRQSLINNLRGQNLNDEDISKMLNKFSIPQEMGASTYKNADAVKSDYKKGLITWDQAHNELKTLGVVE